MDRAVIEFGPFRYDAESRFLYRGDEEIMLPPRVLAVLESLLKRPGKVVAKDAVLESAWEGAFVGEDSLTQAVSQLRGALGDDPQRPTYIQTIPKRGYRFIAEVSEPLRSEGPIPAPAEAPRPPPSASLELTTLAAGTSVGNYELLAQIGAGAMGEVWRARDTELQRDVAIKVVPQHLAGEAAVIERFRREALMLAAVNHPNIATIHGVEESAGVRFIVMELLEGRTLQERLDQGALPVDEALNVALQIAHALEVAHDAGIIHRDLKPANIFVGPRGHVKVLDFGLAKDANLGDGSASLDPTLLTTSGLLIGTAAYMSPEQAAGKPIDKRSDIFSFGCVLFEMLTARRPFPGDNISEIIAAILKDQPDWNLLPATAGPTARALLRRCLRKDPDRRLHDIADARIEISEVIEEPGREVGGPALPAAGGRRQTTRLLTWAIGGAFLTMSGFALGMWITSNRTQLDSIPAAFAAEVGPPTGAAFSAERWRPNAAISPNGSLLAFIAREHGGEQFIYVRLSDSLDLEATKLPETEGAGSLFFSADGNWIAFSADGSLWKVPAAGGPRLLISELGELRVRGAQWLEDGTILLGSSITLPIQRVSGEGGQPEPVTRLDEGDNFGHRLPELLPGGRFLLYYAFPGWPADPTKEGTWVVDLLDMEAPPRLLIRRGLGARYVPTGHLVYTDTQTGTVLAVTFDAGSLELGDPFPTGRSVRPGGGGASWNGPNLDFSTAGTLVYRPVAPAPPEDLVLRTQEGDIVLGEPGRSHVFPRFSSDGRKIAFVRDRASGESALWVLDLDRGGLETPVQNGVGVRDALWLPEDGSLLVTHNANSTISRINADDEGDPTPLLRGDDLWLASVHPEGEALLYRDDLEGQSKIFLVPVADLDGSDPRGRSAHPLVSIGNSDRAAFSPDGDWIAFDWSQGQGGEIWVRPYGAQGAPERVSTSGGRYPAWSPDGTTIYYRNGTSLMAVPFDKVDGVRGPPEEILDRGDLVGPFDVSPAGAFLLRRADVRPSRLFIVLNWFEELKRSVPVGQ